MKLELLDFDLPEQAIAQRPADRRDSARMLVVDPRASDFVDRHVFDWPSLVPAGALVVVNDTSVVKARLIGHKAETGGKVELLLIRKRDEASIPDCEIWRAIGKGLGELRGRSIRFGDSALSGEVLGKSDESGHYEVKLWTTIGSVSEAIAHFGKVPIPPYIRREADSADDERYQTVYARVPGAIAAPTAGLHLTREMLDQLQTRGVRVAPLTLHVGLGTFQPVAVPDLDLHPMHAEWMQVTEELATEVAAARARGAPVIAVGTTVVRALESAADPERAGYLLPTAGETRILIQPGYTFRVVDALLTNFHLPRSTLMALVAAFAGLERALEAYRAAIARGYRFYSYGDAMWIPHRETHS